MQQKDAIIAWKNAEYRMLRMKRTERNMVPITQDGLIEKDWEKEWYLYN